MKIENALDRLNHTLPLKENQNMCAKQVRALHQQILLSFITQGRILTRSEMATYVDDLDDAVNVLRKNEMVIFSGNNDPVGAYPFTMEERENKISVNGYQVYAMCALDALAVSPMFEVKVKIDSRCKITATPLHIEQSGTIIENLDDVGEVCLGIDWGAIESGICCADSLCLDMLFLKDNKIAQQWLANNSERREIFTLPQAVEFASRFFVPLMEKDNLPKRQTPLT